MMTLWYVSILHAALAFLPVALTFPENPNSIDSPLAWHPLSTGVGKLPPGSLRAWWDASKLNANDVYWGDPYIPDSSFSCGGQIQYLGSAVAGGNILTVVPSAHYPGLLNNFFLMGVARPGILFQFEEDLNRTVYEIVSGIDANGFVIATNFTTDTNRFVVKPDFSSTYSNQKILVAQLQRWPDESGNREHMGYWPLAGIRSPGIFVLDSNSGQLFHDGYIAHYGSGNQMLSGIAAHELLSLRHSYSDRGAAVVHELIIGKGPLDSNTRLEMEGYLAWKWGVNEKLAMSHPYAQVSAQSSWNPLQLGNDLWIWLDANARDSVFSDAGCATLSADNVVVSCWKDLSHYQRHLYQGNDFPIVFGQWQTKPGVILNYDNTKGPTSLATAAAATWLNNQNYFIAMVTEKSATEKGQRYYVGGPLNIGNKDFFPFYANACIGVSSAYNNPIIHTQYTAQKATLVLQGNVRNQPFYQPYFHSHIKSSLTTRGAPTYLHEQPYLLAVVASALTEPSTSCSTVLGTLLPSTIYGVSGPSIYKNRALSFGAAFDPAKLWLDQGWSAHVYNAAVAASPAVYLIWRKSANAAPVVTVNGLPREAVTSSGDFSSYLRVLDSELVMLSMGDYVWGDWCRFSGSIYEAMVLTGPKIKYGHQRLIEGYLAWKWGLQHRLPRSHSYRRVPPAR